MTNTRVHDITTHCVTVSAVCWTVLAAGCSISAGTAQTYESHLVAQGAVRPVANAPIRVIGWWITHNSIGTPEVHLTLYNDSSRTIRAYKIGAQLRDDFGNAACIGAEDFRAFTSQEEYWRPGVANTGVWVLYTCDRATHYQFAVLEVVYVEGGRWSAAAGSSTEFSQPTAEELRHWYDCWADKSLPERRLATIENVYRAGGLSEEEYRRCKAGVWDEQSRRYVDPDAR